MAVYLAHFTRLNTILIGKKGIEESTERKYEKWLLLLGKCIDIIIFVYYPFKKYVQYIFFPGCLSMMSRSMLRL